MLLSNVVEALVKLFPGQTAKAAKATLEADSLKQMIVIFVAIGFGLVILLAHLWNGRKARMGKKRSNGDSTGR